MPEPIHCCGADEAKLEMLTVSLGQFSTGANANPVPSDSQAQS